MKKWKTTRVGTRTRHVGRPSKLTERNRRVLKREVRKKVKKSLQIINSGFQQTAGFTVHSDTLRKELHALDIHGCVAAHRQNITPSKNSADSLGICNISTGFCTTGNLFHGATSHTTSSPSRMGVHVFGECQTNVC